MEDPTRPSVNDRGETGVEPGLAERLTSAISHITTLVDDVGELDDVEGGELLEAAEHCAAAVRHRFPDPDDLTNAHRAMVAQYVADELDGRHVAALTVAGRRGPVHVGDLDMRLTVAEEALRYLASVLGQNAVLSVDNLLARTDAR